MLLTVCLLLSGLLSAANAQESSSETQDDAKPQSIDELLLFFPAKYPTGDWQPKDLRCDDVYRSEGTPTVEGALMDARAARAKLCELASTTDSEMLLMGESVGGASRSM